MPLIKCYECKRQISDKSGSCPHCGAPQLKYHLSKPSSLSEPSQSNIAGAVTGAIMGLIVGVSLIMITCGGGNQIEFYTFALLISAPFGILGAVIGWAISRSSKH